MRFVSNEAHCENVAQRRRDEMRILTDEQFEASGKIFVGGLVIHKSVPICVKFAREIWRRQPFRDGSENRMQKADEVVPASATNQKPKAYRDDSGVAGRRISRRRFGERLRCFGRANIGLAQSLLV
jgi:hypothetical protein